MVEKPMATLARSPQANARDPWSRVPPFAATTAAECVDAPVRPAPDGTWIDPALVVPPVTTALPRDALLLVRAVERQVLPRLLLARRAGLTRGPLLESGLAPQPSDVAALVRTVLTEDATAALAMIERLRARGIGLEGLYLDLLTPVARRLGEMWVEDLCSFTDVTLGLGCLHQVLRETGPDFHREDLQRQADRRILLVPVPGEQHTFGLMMVVEFFRRAGWDVVTGEFDSLAALRSMLRREHFALVGFSLGSRERLDGLLASIRTTRRSSRNPAVGVMVGGPMFVIEPGLAAQVGADATAADGRQAVLQAEGLVSILSARQ